MKFWKGMLIAVAIFVACAAGTYGLIMLVSNIKNPINSSYREIKYEMTDGRTVTCLTWKLANAGGMSCDWENASHD